MATGQGIVGDAALLGATFSADYFLTAGDYAQATAGIIILVTALARLYFMFYAGNKNEDK